MYGLKLYILNLEATAQEYLHIWTASGFTFQLQLQQTTVWNIFLFFILFFFRKKAWHFMWIVYYFSLKIYCRLLQFLLAF